MLNEIRDQAAHFALGFGVAIVMTLIGGTAWLAVSAAFGVGFVREVWQHGRPPQGLGSWADVAFWTLGGVTALVI